MTGQSHNGHRSRLRQRFINNGFDGFLDYEVIELLLTFGIPRKDCKSIAKELIDKYKTVGSIINSDQSELIKAKGLGAASIIGIKVAKEIGLYVSKEGIENESSDSFQIDKIAQHLIKEIGHRKKELVKVMCIDTKGYIINETVSIGSLNSSIVHPREVFKTAITNNASSILIAHNHPSGHMEPSESDILTTRRIVEAGRVIGIEVEDHLIVSSRDYKSLRKLGYII